MPPHVSPAGMSFITPAAAPTRAPALWAPLPAFVSTFFSAPLVRRIDRARYVEGTIRYALAGVRHAEPEAART